MRMESMVRPGCVGGQPCADPITVLWPGDFRDEGQSEGRLPMVMALGCLARRTPVRSPTGVGRRCDLPAGMRGRAHCSIDVQMLCGAGLAETKAYLLDREFRECLSRAGLLLQCEAAGDFTDFSVQTWSHRYSKYYLG